MNGGLSDDMLNAILIDDEETNLRLLEKVLDWQALGYRIAGTALDGREGLDLYRMTRPDVVLVDIRMPIMDGIAFIREVRKNDSQVKIVILSAYAEFEYAQKAIEYGIHAYLLKPVDEDKLEQILLAVKTERESEFAASRTQMEREYHKLLDQLEAQGTEGIAANAGLSNPPQAANDSRSMATGANAASEGERKLSAAAHTSRQPQFAAGGSEKRSMPLLVACIAFEPLRGRSEPRHETDFTQFLTDTLQKRHGVTFIKAGKQPKMWVIVHEPAAASYEGGAGPQAGTDLAAASPNAMRQRFVEGLRQLAGQCRARYGQRLLCGVGSPASGLADFPRSYDEARRASVALFYEHDGLVAVYGVQAGRIAVYGGQDDPIAVYGGTSAAPRWSPSEFVARKWVGGGEAQTGNVYYLRQFVQEAFSEFKERRVHPEDVFRFCEEWSALLKEQFAAIDPEFVRMFNDMMPDGLMGGRSCASLEQGMEELAVKAGSALRALMDSNKNYAVIRKAKEFALLHFHEEPFTLKDTADYIGVSKNHFSKMYKEQTGENFWDYVIHLRMEQAKKLLRDTNKTNYEIAGLIGYSSEYHFARLFSKLAGMTTTQYRKLHGS
ncbi:response regulator transcription factor [Paenibacillus thalictri]|uniref:Response regulator n=1 Tax=Paenibacillus thalictri TaxID=2527873 RepID=A0A4Q9DIH7_9BACL|nr:response regulator [Paenibacillus thalictri]TBL72425.1 response regulator [Paenibacillus thalictri]